ncbi:nitric oxide-associated protein 1 [Engraulis encrasicolus]|uniref:nitric oxide-associated protein 1 n=1 Tax=Engraulis encrasicolus TaxID=184585 RepID=UPI002FD4A27E
MYKLLRPSLLRMRCVRCLCLARQLSWGVSQWSTRLTPAWGDDVHLPTSSLAWRDVLGKKNNRISLRRYSQTGPASEDSSGSKKPSSLTSVDPEREEEFSFLEYHINDVSMETSDALPPHLAITDAMVTADKKEKEKAEPREDDPAHRALREQARVLAEAMNSRTVQESVIEFHDEGFLVEETARSDNPRKRRKREKGVHKLYGSPDPDQPVSEVPCSGCGALLHCADPTVPGYLASQKYTSLLLDGGLSKAVCQRCFLLTHHHRALNVTMTTEEYRDVVRSVRPKKALVLLILDLLDMPHSIVADLPDLVGRNKQVVVLGNKVDLLPGDSPNYLSRLRRAVAGYCAAAGVPVADPKDVHLISAKTGYGVENLVTRLQQVWRYQGDVYLVGTANAGKSTLFNTLLESDYSKTRASDIIHKATISPFPGTTLNLLKFPIINPTAHRVQRREERLRTAAHTHTPEDTHRLQQLSKHAYLVGHVGRTFRVESKPREVTFDPDRLSYGAGPEDDGDGGRANQQQPPAEFSTNEIKDARWLYDTPGIMKDKDILSVLSEQEVKVVVPTLAITPRTFILPPRTTLFLGALARIDYLEGENSCWFSVLASSRIPVHVTTLEKADAIYEKHAGRELLKVPTGGPERMASFPPLVPQDFDLIGQGPDTAICDIKLSSAGWVAVTGMEGERLCIRGYAPEAAGMCLRSPPLLPHIATVRGERIKKSPAYKPVKPHTHLLSNTHTRKAKKRS